PRRSVSCRVLRVDSHVLLRQVATPGLGLPAGQPEGGHDLDLRLLEDAADLGQVDIDAGAALEDHQPADAQVELVEGELRATVTERADDPAPVRVAAVRGRLDETRRGHRAGCD